MSVTYEMAEANPDLYRVNANGVICDVETGRFVSTPNGGKNAITQASSSGLNKKRWEQAAEDIRAGGRKAAKTSTDSETNKKIGEKLYNVIDAGQGRDVVSASKAYFQLGDLTDNRRGGDQNTQNIQVTVYNNEISRKIMDIVDAID